MADGLKRLPDSIEKIVVGIGWNHKLSDGHNHDLDSSVLLVAKDGQCHSPEDFCYYQKGHQTVHGGAVIHYGDETNGKTEGDDELIDINLSLMPDSIHKIITVVSIHKGRTMGMNFGQVDGAYIRVADKAGRKIANCDLSEDASLFNAMEFCEIVRVDGGWAYKVQEDGTTGGLAKIIAKYGFSS